MLLEEEDPDTRLPDERAKAGSKMKDEFTEKTKGAAEAEP